MCHCVGMRNQKIEKKDTEPNLENSTNIVISVEVVPFLFLRKHIFSRSWFGISHTRLPNIKLTSWALKRYQNNDETRFCGRARASQKSVASNLGRTVLLTNHRCRFDNAR